MYIWQQDDWPRFRWDAGRLAGPLGEARFKQGQLLGRMRDLGFDLKLETQVDVITEDIVKTSAIEGETLDRTSVRSSVAKRLGLPEAGLPTAGVPAADRRTEGVVEMMLDATQNHDTPLTAARLFGWQAALFPTGYSGLAPVKTGAWRDDVQGPMQVVSGPIGRSRVHFEAPPAPRLHDEMQSFLAWFNAPPADDGLLRAGVAHLWFVTVHPFDDGNGRVGRAIADQALARMERSGQRFYSMSSQIMNERSAYYDMLEHSQKGKLDVTAWLLWFVACFTRAVDGADAVSSSAMRKATFWRKNVDNPLNARQRKVVNCLFDGFEAKLTVNKFAALAKVSPATAQRDIVDLVARGILLRNPGGSKNTSYALAGEAAFAPTQPQDVFASLSVRGKPKTLAEMEAGITREAKRRHARD